MVKNLWSELESEERLAVLAGFFPESLLEAVDSEIKARFRNRSKDYVVERLCGLKNFVAQDRYMEALMLLAA